MISPYLRQLYYTVCRYPMRLSGWMYKTFQCPTSDLRVHLGPGKGKYIEGWVNVDANIISAKLDVWANLLDPLPFRDEAVDVFFSHHVIEHLPDWYLPEHFAQMFKALRPGGGIRIGAPHLGNACRKYVAGDKKWFDDYPDDRESVGGRFVNFIFCRSEHLTALDETYLTELAENVGFEDIHFCTPTKQTYLKDLGINREVFSKEFESDLQCPHTIVLEARKPKN